jgi:hypothetical protein
VESQIEDVFVPIRTPLLRPPEQVGTVLGKPAQPVDARGIE